MLTAPRIAITIVVLSAAGLWIPRPAAAADGSRQLFTISFARDAANVSVPVRLRHRLGGEAQSLRQIDANGKIIGVFPVTPTGPGELTVVLPAQPAGLRIFWLTSQPAPTNTPSGVSAGTTVTMRSYVAHLNPERGGMIDSLRLIARGGKSVETLGADGIQWNWTGTPGRSNQPACANCAVRVVESGPAQ